MYNWLEGLEASEDGDMFDPLCIERSSPVGDEEADRIETLCQSATPGPLVIDDDVSGEAALVVSLPDGRMIVSLTAPVEHTEHEGTAAANAELVCKSRYLLLRLLRDRREWRSQREKLTSRIEELEKSLRSRTKASAPRRPR